MDASLTASRVLPHELNPLAEKAFERLEDDPAMVPKLWWYEIRNLLIINERRGRITQNDTTNYLRFFGRFLFQQTDYLDENHILSLARKYRLTVYDASYLALAEHEVIPLATLDGALIEAAKAAGIELLS